MDRNKIVIIALIAVIIALLVGIFAVMPNFNKQDTTLTLVGNSTITEGGFIEIRLTDAAGNPIANQSVNVTIKDENQESKYNPLITDENGTGLLKIYESAGEYNLTISYGGNDNYKTCSIIQPITIEKAVEAAQSSSSPSNNDPGAFYSAQAGRVIYTGEVQNTPGGLYRHLGYNKWEPV